MLNRFISKQVVVRETRRTSAAIYYTNPSLRTLSSSTTHWGEANHTSRELLRRLCVSHGNDKVYDDLEFLR